MPLWGVNLIISQESLVYLILLSRPIVLICLGKNVWAKNVSRLKIGSASSAFAFLVTAHLSSFLPAGEGTATCRNQNAKPKNICNIPAITTVYHKRIALIDRTAISSPTENAVEVSASRRRISHIFCHAVSEVYICLALFLRPPATGCPRRVVAAISAIWGSTGRANCVATRIWVGEQGCVIGRRGVTIGSIAALLPLSEASRLLGTHAPTPLT